VIECPDPQPGKSQRRGPNSRKPGEAQFGKGRSGGRRSRLHEEGFLLAESWTPEFPNGYPSSLDSVSDMTARQIRLARDFPTGWGGPVGPRLAFFGDGDGDGDGDGVGAGRRDPCLARARTAWFTVTYQRRRGAGLL
jgi:hypothetical protein